MKLVITIPAYNEAPVVAEVINSIPSTLAGIQSIETIVVNDGSIDGTAEIARAAGALVISHPINRGVGVAKTTCLTAGYEQGGDIIVTMDADGQHDPNDLPKLIDPIISGKADIVAGTRLLQQSTMPRIRKLGNKIMNFILRFTWGVKVSDSQSGYRAYSRKALSRINLTTSGFEVDTEILIVAQAAKLKLVEVPIKTIYTEYSRKKGQSPITAIVTFFRLIKRFITG